MRPDAWELRTEPCPGYRRFSGRFLLRSEGAARPQHDSVPRISDPHGIARSIVSCRPGCRPCETRRRSYPRLVKPDANPRPRLEPLLREIAALERRFRAALGENRRIDRVRGFGGANNPYDDFAPVLARLFERARLAFEQGNIILARDAYAALFALLSLKDDYGFAVTRPEGFAIGEHQIRYLRALGENAPGGQRGVLLVQTLRHLDRSLWEGCSATVQSVMESAPLAQGEREDWLDDLTRCLRTDREREADPWLREAVKLRRGGEGLGELARQDSPWRPRAWLDWLETVSAQGDPHRLIEATKEALANIPEGLELRATAADHLAQAAQALGDREALLVARWEAFRAEPFPARLLDLREATPGVLQRRQWMRWAVNRACDETGGTIPGPLVGGIGNAQEVLFTQDGDRFTSGPTPGTEALALMLAGDWRKAFRMARDDAFGDWTGTSSVGMFILSVMMAWLTGWPERGLPANVGELLTDALRGFDAPGESGSGTGERVRVALAEAVRTWKPASTVVGAAVVDGCVRLARGAVADILKRQYSSSGQRAAVLVAAAALVLSARRSDSAALKLLDDLATKHRKDLGFIRELTIRSR